MVLRPGFESWPNAYGASPGWAISVFFSYMVGTHNELSTTHIPELPPKQDLLAGPRDRRSDQVSAVVFMNKNDLETTAPLWLDYSEKVRLDPRAWNETGDEYARSQGMRPWIGEMYGYSFGAAKAGVNHRVDMAAMLYPGHDPLDAPLALHYGRLFEVPGDSLDDNGGGEGGSSRIPNRSYFKRVAGIIARGNSDPIYAFRKHWFHSFDPMLCPKWDHLPEGRYFDQLDPEHQSALLTPDSAEKIAGGLFPHPPHPASLPERATVPEQYRDLLSILVPATLNAAMCERHRVRCPPSAQLTAQCSWATGLEHAILKAIQDLEQNKGEDICADRRGPTACEKLVKNNGCKENPIFMDIVCRQSCGKCRIGTDGGEGSGVFKYNRQRTVKPLWNTVTNQPKAQESLEGGKVPIPDHNLGKAPNHLGGTTRTDIGTGQQQQHDENNDTSSVGIAGAGLKPTINTKNNKQQGVDSITAARPSSSYNSSSSSSGKGRFILTLGFWSLLVGTLAFAAKYHRYKTRHHHPTLIKVASSVKLGRTGSGGSWSFHPNLHHHHHHPPRSSSSSDGGGGSGYSSGNTSADNTPTLSNYLTQRLLQRKEGTSSQSSSYPNSGNSTPMSFDEGLV